MPESPDFERIAFQIALMFAESVTAMEDEIREHPDTLDGAVKQLRLVWNARGAADIEAADQHVEVVKQIRKLDR